MNQPETPDESTDRRDDENDGTPAWARRFKAKLDSVEKPKKITRDEVLNHWDDSYEQRREVLAKTKRPSTLAMVVTIGALLGSIWMGLSTSSGASGFESASRSNQTQISQLKSSLSAAQQDQTKVPSAQDSRPSVANAYTQAKKVADLQNTMIDASKLPTSAPADKKEADSKRSVAASNAMMAYVDQASAAGIQQWYYITPDSSNPYHATSYRWTAEVPYEFNSNSTTIRITWLCRDTKTNVVLAWSQGEYQASSKKFVGLAWGMTLEGAKRVSSPIDNAGSAGASSSAPAPSSSSSVSSKSSSSPSSSSSKASPSSSSKKAAA